MSPLATKLKCQRQHLLRAVKDTKMSVMLCKDGGKNRCVVATAQSVSMLVMLLDDRIVHIAPEIDRNGDLTQ